MTRGTHPEPSAATLANIVIARARSRLAVSEITEQYTFSLLSIFRDEIGASVSRASAFLLAVLESMDYDLDALAWSIRPARGWPFRSISGAKTDQRPVRRGASKAWANRKLDIIMRNGGGPIIPLGNGGRARVRVMDDCLDASATFGPVGFVSMGGRIRVSLPWAVSTSVIEACIGQPVSDVIDLAVCAFRDWPIIAAERSSASSGCTFVADVGTRSYLLPWARNVD